MSRVHVDWTENGEVAEYQLDPPPDLATGLARQLAEDDQIKRRMRASGQDPLKMSFEERMRWIAPTNGASANGHSKNGKPSRRVLTTTALQVERAQAKWLDDCCVPLGKVTIVAGPGGVGKSQWTCLLAGQLSRGELGDPAASLIATAEDDQATTVVPRLEAVQADLSRVHFLTIATREGNEDGIEIPDDLPQVEETVRNLGARLLVIDPLVAHLPEKIDSHRDQSVRRALAPLYRLAKNTDCAVVAVLHLNKSAGLAPLMRLPGSVAFGNAVRSVLLLERDPDDPDGERGHRRILAHIKSNLGPLAPSLLYLLAAIVLEAEGAAPMVETSRLELLGESEHDGRALLDAGDDEERSAREEAVDFLREYLADGERHSVADIYKEAGSLRINDRTLRRARSKLGVKVEKSGFRGGWQWWLPEVDKQEAEKGANPHSSTNRPDTPSAVHLSTSISTEGDNNLAYLDEVDSPEVLATSVQFADDEIPFWESGQ